MDEEKITIKGKQLRNFQKLKGEFEGLGFTAVSSEKGRLVLEKTETESLKGKAHSFYRASFLPDKLEFTYSIGANKRKRDLEALFLLSSMIKVADGFYEFSNRDVCAAFSKALDSELSLADSEKYATAGQLLDLQEKFDSLSRKYRDLALSSEQNARILLECEKKRDSYQERIRQLEGVSDELLRQEVFKWLKTHSGEISVSQFAKSYDIAPARVEEALDALSKSGHIRKMR